MKLYYFYSDSHDELCDKWFLPSIQDPFELVAERHEQVCPSGSYMDAGWVQAMTQKVDLILRGIEENPNTYFVHSDVDVQFFRPVLPYLESLSKSPDVIIQRNDPSGGVCPGFMFVKGNKKTDKLWRTLRELIEQQEDFDDQGLLNILLGLARGPYDVVHGVEWDYLPPSFYSYGIESGKVWNPGDEIILPPEIFLHHANWTIGDKNKKLFLENVRSCVSNSDESGAQQKSTS